MADAFTPTDFFKGDEVVTANSWSEYYQFIFDGWTLGGPAGELDPHLVGASQGYVNDALESLQVEALPSDLSRVLINDTAQGTLLIDKSQMPSTLLWTLGGNLVLTLAATGMPTDTSGTATVILKQPAAGTFTVTWPTNVQWPNGAPAPVMPTAANSELVVHFFWTGRVWRAMVGGSYFP